MASERAKGDINCGKCGSASVCLTMGWGLFALKLVRCSNCHKMFFMRGEAADRYDVHAIVRVRLEQNCEERWLMGADRRAEVSAAKCPACGAKPWPFWRWNTESEKQEILDRARERREEYERQLAAQEREKREAGQLPLFAAPADDADDADDAGDGDNGEDNEKKESGSNE